MASAATNLNLRLLASANFKSVFAKHAPVVGQLKSLPASPQLPLKTPSELSQNSLT